MGMGSKVYAPLINLTNLLNFNFVPVWRIGYRDNQFSLSVANNPWRRLQVPNVPPPASTSAGGANKRSSLPPGFRPFGHLQQQQQHYSASPLQHALTPPPPDPTGPNDPEPFPSVESHESATPGQNFHISATGLPGSASTNDSSPMQHHARHYGHSQSSSVGSKSDTLEIFCASCGRPWLLKNAFACTECICGVCSDCVGQITSSPVATGQPAYAPTRRGCPRCGVMGGKWKRPQFDFR